MEKYSLHTHTHTHTHTNKHTHTNILLNTATEGIIDTGAHTQSVSD